MLPRRGRTSSSCASPSRVTSTMRVWERGVGRRRRAARARARRSWPPAGGCRRPPARASRRSGRVDVPGGRLRVTERPDGRVELAGPAVLVSPGRAAPGVGRGSPVSDASVAPRVAAGIRTVLGGGYMISRYAKAVAEENGFTNRVDVLLRRSVRRAGRGRRRVVLRLSVFFYEPDTRASRWAERRAAGLAPEVGAERYRQACFAWGRARLEGFEGAGRLADLLEPLSTPPTPRAAPIFAGWRALRPSRAGRRPGPGGARRAPAARAPDGACTRVAVRALQMDPLDAILSGVGRRGQRRLLRLAPALPRRVAPGGRPPRPSRTSPTPSPNPPSTPSTRRARPTSCVTLLDEAAPLSSAR